MVKSMVKIVSLTLITVLSAIGQSCTKSCHGQNKCCTTMETQNKAGGDGENFASVEACSLTSKEQAKRYMELKDSLFKKISKVNELNDGYDLVFEENIDFSYQLIEFINFERICCPSFTFVLSFEPNKGPVHLEIKGSKGIKDMIAFGLKEHGFFK